MLDFSFGELALVVLVALLVVGPKDLPVVMRAVGKWFGQFKVIADEFREGFKSAMHGGGLGEMEKDLTAIHHESEYIRDQDGNLQRTYDIADFLDERERSKVTIAPPAQQKTSS
jgi:Tat protein translocase TatB subunit